MNRILTSGATALLLASSSACASTTSTPSSDQAGATVTVTASSATTAAATVSPQALSAELVMTKLTAAISQVQQTATFTEDNDPNHFLGRPHEYTSKVEFKDTRIDAGAVQAAHEPPGGLQFGGSIEVFTSSADAAARAAYIQQATAALPIEAEYDYVHGDVLIRVSHYVTPTQAKAYEAFANTLP